jgi:hypothetical protein
MYRVTGTKRKNEYVDSDEEQLQPPAAKHPTPPLNTSRCTVKAIAGHQAPLQEPPRFPGEPLNPRFGVWGWLPASLADEFLERMRNDPLMQVPPQEPDPLRVAPLDIPLAVVAQSTADTGTDTDAQLLEELEAACEKQVASNGRASSAVKTLQQPGPLHKRIARLIDDVNEDNRVAQGLLPLVERCAPGTRVRYFVMSLFLVMMRTPDGRHRKKFIDNLPPTLSPQLQGYAVDIQNFWCDTATDMRCIADTQKLARQVCAHFGWPVPD